MAINSECVGVYIEVVCLTGYLWVGRESVGPQGYEMRGLWFAKRGGRQIAQPGRQVRSLVVAGPWGDAT